MEQEEALGLMKITAAPALASTREVLNPQSISPAFLTTIKAPTFYRHAVITFYGNGDPQIIIRVYYGGSYASYIGVPGNVPRIVTVANTTVELVADNTDSTNSRVTPTIEILSLSWS